MSTPLLATQESIAPASKETFPGFTATGHTWWGHWTCCRRVGERDTRKLGVCVDSLPFYAPWLTAQWPVFSCCFWSPAWTSGLFSSRKLHEIYTCASSWPPALDQTLFPGSHIHNRRGEQSRVLALTLVRECKKDGYGDEHGDGVGETE